MTSHASDNGAPVAKFVQEDLFGEGGASCPDAGAKQAKPPGPPPAELTDKEIRDLLPQADLATVDGLCDEVVARRLHDAVPALLRLWRKYHGFGWRRPLRQQEAVLETLSRLAGLDCPGARRALVKIVDARDFPASLLRRGLRACSDCSLTLSLARLKFLLADDDPEVRGLVHELCSHARPLPKPQLLEPGLSDPSPRVRTAAAIALGRLGHAVAKPVLLSELSGNPTERVVDALSRIADDDVAVRLGRCVAKNPSLKQAVVRTLNDIGSRKALAVASQIADRNP